MVAVVLKAGSSTRLSPVTRKTLTLDLRQRIRAALAATFLAVATLAETTADTSIKPSVMSMAMQECNLASADA